MAVSARFSHGNRGAALVVALVFLIIITALALAATRSSTLELRMAVNNELSTSARQIAFGLGEAVSANPGATPVVGTAGNRVCTSVAGAGSAIAPDEAPMARMTPISRIRSITLMANVPLRATAPTRAVITAIPPNIINRSAIWLTR